MAEKIVEGLAVLEKRLEELGRELGGKQLRGAVSDALQPIVKQIRAAAPVGTRAHKTYRGRLVAPGFLSQSVRKRSKFYKRTGTATAQIGVLAEAFYGVQFLDEPNPGNIKHFKPQHWFRRTFIASRDNIEQRFKTRLQRRIARAIKK